MAVYHATKTLALIEETIQNDQGASFRSYLGKVISHIGDAYNADNFPFRSHLGASGIGKECAREIWYGFRWTTKPAFGGRLLRLFNRGHLEEARFIAMLLAIGADVFQQDEKGNQYRISDAGGHFGGSGDGVVVNIPDLEPGTPALAEFKTAAEKKFLEFVKQGVRSANFTYYVQMQMYMKKMGLAVALFMVVNKNNDELYAELVPFDSTIADEFIGRGVSLVWRNTVPNRISESPGWYGCRFCDHRPTCHLGVAPHENCRTCEFSEPRADGKWYCNSSEVSAPSGALTKSEQFDGCAHYKRKF